MDFVFSRDLSISEQKEQLATKFVKQFKELRKAQNLADEYTFRLINNPTNQEYEALLPEARKLVKKHKRINSIIEKELVPCFLNLYGDKIISISDLVDISLFFLKAYIAEFSNKEKDHSEINEIAYLAIATYLESWLDADHTCRQTLHRFAEYPYAGNVKYIRRGDNESRKIADPHPLAPSRIKAFHMAYKDYEKFHEIKKEQSFRESTFVSELPEKTKSGRLLDFTTLAWIEAHHEKALNLLISMHKEMELMSDSMESKKRTYLNCTDYYRYLKDINAIEISDKTSEEQKRRFVAASMMLHRLERTYHFSFSALYCKMVLSGVISPFFFNPAIYQHLMGRYISTNLLFGPTWSEQNFLNKKDSETHYSYDSKYMQIMDYSRIMKLIHTPPYASDTQVQELYIGIAKEAFYRNATQDLQFFLHSLYKPDQQEPWTDELFNEAALFYKEKYPVVQELLKYDFPELEQENGDQFYSRYRKIFNFLDSVKDSELRNARDMFI